MDIKNKKMNYPDKGSQLSETTNKSFELQAHTSKILEMKNRCLQLREGEDELGNSKILTYDSN
jgi:hypothetical protein